jgi:hypothetical protein
MPGVITTGSLPKLLWPGLKAISGATYRQHPKYYDKWASTVTSDKAWEEYQGITGLPFAQQKPQGQSMAFGSQQQGFNTRITNATYALGYIVTMEERQDNLYMDGRGGVYGDGGQALAGSRAKMNAVSMIQTKEVITHLVPNQAFTSGANGGDGVSLCNTAHPTVTGLTYSNAASPAASLSEASLEDAMIAIRQFKDDYGLFTDVHVKCLLIPPQLLYTATRILKSPYQSQTANNDINALKYTGAIPMIVESIYLTSPGAWFLVTDSGMSGYGVLYQERMAVEPVQDNDFSTRNFQAGMIERYAAGWDNPRGIYGSNASG